MKFALIVGLMLTMSEISCAQSLGKDTLHYADITLETGCYVYFFPNGKYLCCYDQGNMNFREYGNWKISGDSIRVNIQYLHEYIGITELEKRIDTNYYETFPLNSNRRPRFTELRLDDPGNNPLPKDILFDKLR